MQHTTQLLWFARVCVCVWGGGWRKQASQNVFYAWHYGDEPKNIENMQAIGAKWNVPTFGTETGCSQFDAAACAGEGMGRHALRCIKALWR